MKTPPGTPRVLEHNATLVFVDKPTGWLVHPGWARGEVTLLHWTRDTIGAYVHPLHRLDRGASGVVAFALTQDAAREMGARFAAQAVEKRYVALVRGPLPQDELLIDHPLPPDEDSEERVPAQTTVRHLGRFERYDLVEARPHTGRLHQIRRHLKHVGCPLIGDVRYGKGEHNRALKQRFGLSRLALHCVSLALTPSARVDCPLPDDLAVPLGAMGLSATQPG